MVTVLPGLDAILADTVTSCPRVDVMLQVDTVFGGNGQYSYDWGTGGSLADSLTVNLRNTQNFCVTIHDGCETPAITRCATVAITPVPPMELSVDSVLGCEPFTVHFSMNDTTGGATADWNFGYGPTQTERPMTMAHVYAQYGTFDLRVNVHWPNGCSMDSIYSNLIKVIDVPHADFSWTPYPASIFNNEVHFHELATDIADTFEWDLAGMDSSFLPDPVFTFPDDLGRNYPVRLIVRNYLGCADTIWKLVNVEDAFLVYVPTAFTPDGDGLNEVLNVVGNDIADHDFHFMVFDRWGEKIYDTTDRHAGWDGKMNGKVVKNGVYTWLLRAQSVYNGVNHDLQGHVTVVR
ncbi:MAG: gliding motility-associated C-terminal domain-containing protein [Flavobacteriales bacterium]|nr:gliding motility-associated C-terminal domain-containing protein [Flavobacteriales bacterium]